MRGADAPAVGRTASVYERELREILQGDAEALRRYGRRQLPTDRPAVEEHARRPFLVVRAAGSLGFDLVALRPEFAFPIEVKGSREATIRFSAAGGRAHAQLLAHRRTVERVGLFAVYAFRRIGGEDPDCWRLFATADGATSRGLMGIIRRELPPVARTREGNGVLRWEEGLPLLRFLGKIAFLTAPSATGPAA